MESGCGSRPASPSLSGVTMAPAAELSCLPTATRTDLGAIFVSLELSRTTWPIASLPPGGERMSRHSVRGGDLVGLLERFASLRDRALARTGTAFPLVVIQEAGLDGFWLHRALEREGIESHAACAASIATSRRSTARQDRPDLWRGARARPAGPQAWRVAGLRHGARTHPRGGGPPAVVPRAQDPRRRAGAPRQPRPWRAVRPRRRRLRPTPPRPAGPARGASCRATAGPCRGT